LDGRRQVSIYSQSAGKAAVKGGGWGGGGGDAREEQAGLVDVKLLFAFQSVV